jgi:5'-AMP-activated protein kinase catalytic alpha subunit
MGMHIQTNQKVAIKILDKEMIKQQGDEERVNREIVILRKVRHPNIV